MKYKNVKLSILIPTYNRENFVSMAIDSVLNQKFQDFEIICSDNASDDNTYKILIAYAQKDNRIKVFQNDKNLGPVLNWKNCLDHASGEFIHWLWSDDWIESNFYVDAFQLMDQDNTRMVTTWNYRSDNLEDVNDKYLSWQFSYKLVPGVVAAKKILLGTYELPVSPAAYIMESTSVRKHFYLGIIKIDELLDPVEKGVGVDSLIVAGSCLEVDYLSVLQKPSVVFRKHDNISVHLNENGTLNKMYLLSHVWFLSKENSRVNMEDFFELLVNMIKISPKGLFSIKILGMLAKILSKGLFLPSSSESYKEYRSKTSFFKNKRVAYLDDKTKKIDFTNKKIYLAPLNDVTKELYKEFETLNPHSIGFIDNFKKGDGIITSMKVKEYDNILIYSPNYYKEIYANLPEGEMYLIIEQKNNFFGLLRYTGSGILKLKLHLLINFFKDISFKKGIHTE